MTLPLRPYQQDLYGRILAAWDGGARNTLAVAPTGAGKTVLFCHAIHALGGRPTVACAHRRELLGQMSLTLGRFGIPHRLLATAGTVREITSLHMRELGRSWLNDRAPAAVASVPGLARRESDNWSRSVELWIGDEGHHYLAGNQFGTALSRFPRARGLGVTATPLRADGKGLGRHADGVFDALVEGPPLRSLIDEGYLTDYRIYGPSSDIDLSQVHVTESGDYSGPELRKAAERSHIVGDVVDAYLRYAPGKRGITFAVSVELAAQTAQRFRDAGVPAEAVDAKTPELVRAEIVRRFRDGKLLQLVNVDLFGEGFDLPAVEAVSMARPTESFGLYCQQFGRALRPMAGKTHAVIIDHVGNVMRHLLPDTPRVWTLDRRERRARTGDADGGVPLRVCAGCTAVYPRTERACPYCGDVPVPASRSAPEHVDGDLAELDPAVLARMRGEAVLPAGPKIPWGAAPEIVGALHKRHRAFVSAQTDLRASIAQWAGWRKAAGKDDPAIHREFYYAFGTDVLSAQALRTADAEALRARIEERMPTL